MNQHLSVKQVCGLFPYKPKTIRAWIKAGKIQASKLGTEWLIDSGDLQKRINSRKTSLIK